MAAEEGSGSMSMPNSGEFPIPQPKNLEGYDNEFAVSDTQFECPVCLLYMRDPHQTSCGHRFCRHCINKWIQDETRNRKCPVCNDKLTADQIYPDNYTKREILQLEAYCLNKKLGCTKKLPLKDLLVHQTGCEYKPVSCPNKCGCTRIPSALQEHLEEECVRRRVKCSICRHSYEFRNIEQHQQMCATAANICRNCCLQLTDHNQEQHECGQHISVCKFQRFGCGFSSTEAMMTQHMIDYNQEHMIMLARTLEDLLDDQTMAPNIRSYVNQVSPISLIRTQPDQQLSPQSDPDLSEARGGSAETPFADYENVELIKPSRKVKPKLRSYKSLSDDDQSLKRPTVKRRTTKPGVVHPLRVSYDGEFLNNASNDLDTMNELRRTVATQQQHILELRSKVSYLERQSSDLKHRLSDTATDLKHRNCDGTFIWRIHNYSRLKEDAQRGVASNVLHSPGFYTSFNGYQFCLRLNLTGTEQSSSPHLALFIHLMQSDNDDILSWPFSGKVTFTVIDQSDISRKRNNITETLIAKPGLAAFQRPTTFRNHKGFGYVEFISLTHLQNQDYDFIKNNTLIIRVDVRPSEACSPYKPS